jgi:hypothetical protein
MIKHHVRPTLLPRGRGSLRLNSTQACFAVIFIVRRGKIMLRSFDPALLCSSPIRAGTIWKKWWSLAVLNYGLLFPEI